MAVCDKKWDLLDVAGLIVYDKEETFIEWYRDPLPEFDPVKNPVIAGRFSGPRQWTFNRYRIGSFGDVER